MVAKYKLSWAEANPTAAADQPLRLVPPFARYDTLTPYVLTMGFRLSPTAGSVKALDVLLRSYPTDTAPRLCYETGLFLGDHVALHAPAWSWGLDPADYPFLQLPSGEVWDPISAVSDRHAGTGASLPQLTSDALERGLRITRTA
jgi:hypothetical protein